MRFLFTSIALIFFSLKGIANQTNYMETIYSQKHTHYTLSLVRGQEGKLYHWSTILTNDKNGKQLVIDSDLIESESRFYNIIFSYLNDKDLYVFYDKLGTVYLAHFHFTDSYTFEKNDVLIHIYMCTNTTGMRSGGFRHAKFQNKIFFYLSPGLNPKKDDYYTLDLSTSQLKKMVFKDNYRMAVAVHADTKDLYDNISYHRLTKERIEEINEYNKYTKIPYHLFEVSNNEEERQKEIDKYENIGLEIYPTFEVPYEEIDRVGKKSNYRDLSKRKERKRANRIFNEVLTVMGYRTKKSVEIQDYFQQSSMYFFFYLDERGQTKIARYDMEDNFWYIGDFEEVDFEPRIDIYKSPDSRLK